MRWILVLLSSIFLASCASVIPGKIYTAKQVNFDVSDGVESELEQLFSSYTKYENENIIGWRVPLNPSQTWLLHEDLKQAFNENYDNCPRTILVSATSRGVSLKRHEWDEGEVIIGENKGVIPNADNIHLRKATNQYTSKLDDLICGATDDTETYPPQKVLRAMTYVKFLREWEDADPEGKRIKTTGYTHIILVKPHYVHENLILPALKRYEEDYKKRLVSNKNVLSHIIGPVGENVTMKFTQQSKVTRYGYQTLEVFMDNREGSKPVELDLNFIGDLSVDGRTFSVGWHFVNGTHILYTDHDCLKVEKGRVVVANPGQFCEVRVPIIMNAVDLADESAVNSEYEIYYKGLKRSLKVVTAYDEMTKHPIVFSDDD
jgi:hypothetical protein